MGRKSNSFSDFRCFLGLLGLALTIAGAIMIYVDHRKAWKHTETKVLEYQLTVPILVPLLSLIGFLGKIPQMYAFSLWVLYDVFPELAGWAHADRVSHYVKGTKLEFAALVILMIGMLLGAAPMLKDFKMDSFSLIPLILCGLMWFTTAVIFGAKDKDPAKCSTYLILFVMVVLAVFLRSLSISFAVAFISLEIIITTMDPIITGIVHKNSEHAAAYCLSYAAAIIWVAWMCFDLHRNGVPDRLSHKKGGWEKIN